MQILRVHSGRPFNEPKKVEAIRFQELVPVDYCGSTSSNKRILWERVQVVCNCILCALMWTAILFAWKNCGRSQEFRAIPGTWYLSWGGPNPSESERFGWPIAQLHFYSNFYLNLLFGSLCFIYFVHFAYLHWPGTFAGTFPWLSLWLSWQFPRSFLFCGGVRRVSAHAA